VRFQRRRGMVFLPGDRRADERGLRRKLRRLSALLAMLNSCAAGIAVMNIDNGFGAGYFAHLVNK